MLGAILALMLDGAPAVGPADASTVEWLRRPTAQEVADLYPEAALRRNLAGRAVVACTVDAQGRLTACEVEEESPPGVGFGEAVLRVAKLFQLRPATNDGKPVAGGRIRIPIQFTVPGGKVDDLTVTLKCYGRTSAAYDASPSEEGWDAARTWLSQALVRTHDSGGKLAFLETNLGAYHAAAAKETDAQARPTLKECVDAIRKPAPSAPK